MPKGRIDAPPCPKLAWVMPWLWASAAAVVVVGCKQGVDVGGERAAAKASAAAEAAPKPLVSGEDAVGEPKAPGGPLALQEDSFELDAKAVLAVVDRALVSSSSLVDGDDVVDESIAGFRRLLEDVKCAIDEVPRDSMPHQVILGVGDSKCDAAGFRRWFKEASLHAVVTLTDAPAFGGVGWDHSAQLRVSGAVQELDIRVNFAGTANFAAVAVLVVDLDGDALVHAGSVDATNGILRYEHRSEPSGCEGSNAKRCHARHERLLVRGEMVSDGIATRIDAYEAIAVSGRPGRRYSLHLAQGGDRFGVQTATFLCGPQCLEPTLSSGYVVAKPVHCRTANDDKCAAEMATSMAEDLSFLELIGAEGQRRPDDWFGDAPPLRFATLTALARGR